MSTKYIVSYATSGKVMVEAEDEETAKAIVARCVKERELRPKLMLTAESLDEIPSIP